MPVALSKIFRHSCIYIRTDAGIRTPQDLLGKRWERPARFYRRCLYEWDAATRVRCVTGGYSLVHWRIDRPNSPTCASIQSAGENQDRLPPLGQTLRECWRAGISTLCSRCIFLPSSRRARPRIARLFPNYYEVEQDYYRRTRIFPIMHTVAVRDDVYREHPWVTRSIYKAFCEARDLAINGLYDTDALRLSLPWLINHIEEIGGY